jgi:NADH-quinone oxidoreductase subunit M
MIPLLLILIPLIAGLLSFALKGNGSKALALASSIVTLIVAVCSLCATMSKGSLSFDAAWLTSLHARLSLNMDGMAKMLCLLTAISFPTVFIATYNNTYKSNASFYGLLLLTQAGLTGVFLASDALLFYFFWELALIPVYFLCSQWGGEKRIAVTFKFFIYTFKHPIIRLPSMISIMLF